MRQLAGEGRHDLAGVQPAGLDDRKAVVLPRGQIVQAPPQLSSKASVAPAASPASPRQWAKAAKSPLGTSTTQECRQQITQAGAFLVWLAARHVTLESCTQTDLDAWHAQKYANRRPAQAFLAVAYGDPPDAAAHHPERQEHHPHRHRSRSTLEELRTR
ncbi:MULTISPECIES: hypothetical protein [unclassified Streptomyces]|uniref:hypothetical protein n=1 Tax=unclassified Streptomyces TaxID=2593676 RepID=UPI003442B43A